MKGRMLSDAIEKLAREFPHLHWDFRLEPVSGKQNSFPNGSENLMKKSWSAHSRETTSRNGFTVRVSSSSICLLR